MQDMKYFSGFQLHFLFSVIEIINLRINCKAPWCDRVSHAELKVPGFNPTNALYRVMKPNIVKRFPTTFKSN